MSLQAGSKVALIDVASHGDYCSAGHGSFLNILVLLLVSTMCTVSLSGVDVILMCRSLTSSVSSVCSPSDIEFHFQHLASAGFVVRHVVYYGILVCLRRSENYILFVYLEDSLVSFRNISSSVAINSFGDVVSPSRTSPDVDRVAICVNTTRWTVTELSV